MRGKLPSVTICALFITAVFISVDMGFEVVKNVEGATIYVPTDYPTIQAAIDAASDGDTVFVHPRSSLYPPMTYWEDDLFINKKINLIGENKETTIIEGAFSRYTLPYTIYISEFAHDVTISGFTIVSGGTGIVIDGNRANISGNVVTNTGSGGSIGVNSDDNIVSNNILTGGITLFSGADRNTISKNTITYSGISLNYNSENEITKNTISNGGIIIVGNVINHWASHNIDTSNTIKGNPILYWKNKDGGTVPSGYGQVILANCKNLEIFNQDLSNVRVGIELGFSSIINITCVTTSNNDYGIYLSHSNNNNIIDCTFADNYIDGIHLRYSNDNHIIGNYIFKNGHWPLPWEEGGVEVDDAGITLVGSSNNHIYHNDFIDNIIQASDDRTDNYWDNGYPSGGNFWSEYPLIWGEDFYKGPNQDILGSDGIGDYPNTWWSYLIDNYPLMEPFNTPPSSNLPPVANSGNDQIAYANETVHFYGSNSLDSDDNILIYSWDFGDGSPLNYEENPIHIYKNPGVYYVTLTVWDRYRLTDSDTCIINVKPSLQIELKYGWNLISLPSKQSSTNLQAVFKSIEDNYDIIQYYNSSDHSDHWKHFNIQKPSYMNDLHHLNHEMGFWIHVTRTEGSTLFLDKDLSPYTQITHLSSGWNIVGYPGKSNRIRNDALNNLKYTIDVDSIWTFNAITQKWFELEESDYFELGKGYWIHVNDDCDWLVFSPILNLDKNRYYPTIQDAIDDADPYDTIKISPGVYNEELTISKPITLQGKSNQTTIIKGNINPVITIMADDVTVSNLNLSGGRYGVDIQESQRVLIKNNVITEFRLSGIIAINSSVHIKNNQISNDPQRTGGFGIKLTKCNDVIIENNTVKDIVYSLYLMYSSGLIQNNIISPTDGYDDRQDSIGIALYFYCNVTVIHNSITGADVGIGVEFESCPYIYENIIANSEYYGIFSRYGRSIVIINNTLSNGEVLLRNSSINNLELISGYAVLVNSTISNYEVKNEAELTVKWYMDVKVVNQKGYPIFGVRVIVKNNLGHLIGGNYFTDIDGYVREILITEFWEGNAGKLYFTPHNVTAVLGTHEESANPEPLMNESKEVVIMVDHGGGG